MKTKTTESLPANAREEQTMTRGKALKKAAKITLAAGTMMVLLNKPEKALALSGAPGGSGSSVSNFTSGGDW
jgi:hypothetical protein